MPQSSAFHDVVEFAKSYLRSDEEKLSKLYFHNECHTFHPVKGVLSVALKLAIIDGMSYTDEAYERIGLAAALHDIGNIVERQEHEQISIDVSRNKLIQLGYDRQMIEAIACCIYSTAIDYSDGLVRRTVGSREAKIVSDADLSNPGFLDVTNFAAESIKIWLEMDEFGIEDFSTTGVALTKTFFNQIGDYYTGTARHLFSERRQKNLAGLEKAVEQLLNKANYSEQTLIQILSELDKTLS
ncbi:HD domain-containing protein [Planctobacterium marinum]